MVMISKDNNPMTDGITTIGKEIDEMVDILPIAIVCHEANRAYCLSMGDTSQSPWLDAPDWQKESVMGGVVFHMNHPDAKPEDSHNNWLGVKAEDGWKYGEVKDAEKKEHPCCVPYEQLPEAQKVKDRLFIAIVRAMLPTEEPEQNGIHCPNCGFPIPSGVMLMAERECPNCLEAF